MIRAYKHQLDLNSTQRKFLAQAFGNARFVYNWALTKRINAYQQNKQYLSAYDLCKMLTILKHQPGMEWLSLSPVICLRQAIFNMDSAFERFFKSKKGFPKFRSKYSKQRIQFTNIKMDFDGAKVKLTRIGWLKIFNPRRFEGTTSTVTVSLNAAGKYFVAVIVHTSTPIPTKRPVIEATTIGLDAGLKDYAVLSDGTRISNPRHRQKGEKRLGFLQRRLSKKVPGSNRRKRAKLAVAKHHYKTANQQKDFMHKLTSQLVKSHDSIVIESLNISGMMKNHCLAKHIASAAWSELFRQLEYKCEWNGKNLIKIGQWEPSSRRCICGLVNKELTLKDRTWKCPSCGEVHDRDLLAAKNIKMFGLRDWNLKQSGEAIAVEDVEVPVVIRTCETSITKFDDMVSLESELPEKTQVDGF